MKTFYWGDVPQNFGDVLTANILKHYGIEYQHTNKQKEANYFSTGSIVRLAKNATVLGSGIIRQGEDLDPNNTYRFVRGPLTRKRILECGGSCPEIYGDPALLLPRFCSSSEKKYKVGLIPHYQDYKRVKEQYKDYHVINVVNNNPLEVAKEISSCEKIISSSLHGIISAHAYDIPAARVIFSKLHGDGSKFEDYCASVDISAQASTVINPIYNIGNKINLDIIEGIFKEYD